MRFITSGHFTAHVDAYDPDAPFVKIEMSTPVYMDREGKWRGELEDEMRKLEGYIDEYIAYARRLREEERAYAV